MTTGYVDQHFIDYILESARSDKAGARTDAVEFIKDRIAMGLFPGKVRNFNRAFGRWSLEIPRELRLPCCNLYKEYKRVVVSRRSVRRLAKAQKERIDSAYSAELRSSRKKKTYSLMDMMGGYSKTQATQPFSTARKRRSTEGI